MQRFIDSISSPLLFVLVLVSCASRGDFPVLEGPYLGQNPPGLTPEVFAPGIISMAGRYEGGATFSQDGQLFIYKRFYREKPDPEEIWLSELQDGRWTPPFRPSFDGEYGDWDFHFAPFGRRFYFTSRRPAVLQGATARPSNIWVTERVPSGWTEPRLLEYPVNTVDSYSGFPSLTRDSTIYFHSERDDGFGEVDIYRARRADGKYLTAEPLPPPVNTEYREFDPCIAPDESYLLFISNRPVDNGPEYDTFITFRSADDSWSEPQGLWNTLGYAGLPNITPDGQLFFFVGGQPDSSQTADIYWVDTRIFDQFRPEPRP
ncbi:MAG: PD40 domain-containing protein [Fidelibacterota bacterium]|nr:MAG: PD40 domain-containing protein [Candidatus Neomarinimicrobiota bacterium]